MSEGMIGNRVVYPRLHNGSVRILWSLKRTYVPSLRADYILWLNFTCNRLLLEFEEMLKRHTEMYI